MPSKSILVAFVLFGTLPSSAARSQAVAPADAAGQSPLSRALALMPAEASVRFTDWSLIKRFKRLTELTSQSGVEQRTELVGSTIRDQAAVSRFAVAKFVEHAQAWGWDPTDLEWEASGGGQSLPPVYVLKFRQGFGLAPVRVTTALYGTLDDFYPETIRMLPQVPCALATSPPRSWRTGKGRRARASR